MAVRDGAEATLAHRAATMVAGHLGVQAGFINKHQPADIPAGLLPAPKPPGGLNLRPILLGGARRFFIAQTELFQTVPQSGDADGNFQVLPTPFLEFVQGQIRLRPNPTAQGSVMLFQAGAPVTADLFGPALAGQTVLLPKTLHAFAADAKAPANFAGACPPRARAAMIRWRKS